MTLLEFRFLDLVFTKSGFGNNKYVTFGDAAKFGINPPQIGPVIRSTLTKKWIIKKGEYVALTSEGLRIFKVNLDSIADRFAESSVGISKFLDLNLETALASAKGYTDIKTLVEEIEIKIKNKW